jgi:hypothetical protein
MLEIPVNVLPDISQSGLLVMLILYAKPNVTKITLQQQQMQESVLARLIGSGQNVIFLANGTTLIKLLKLLL